MKSERLPTRDLWTIRQHSRIENLVRTEPAQPSLRLNPIPLGHRLIEADHPVWDGSGLTAEQKEAFLALERSGEISSYRDIAPHAYGHKFGGHPSYCQSARAHAEYDFVFQISVDARLHPRFIKKRHLSFWRHPILGVWILHTDFR